MLLTFFTSEPSSGLSSIGLKLVSSHDLHRMIFMRLYKQDHAFKQSLILELFSRHDEVDIQYQQRFMQEERFLPLFHSSPFRQLLKVSLYQSMVSQHANISYITDGLVFLNKQAPDRIAYYSHRSITGQKRKREENLLDDIIQRTDELCTNIYIRKDANTLATRINLLQYTANRLHHHDIQRIMPSIGAILSNEAIADHNEVLLLRVALQFLLKNAPTSNHSSMETMMPVVINRLGYITDEISDAAYQVLLKVYIPRLNDTDFQAYWDKTTQKIADQNELKTNLLFLKALISRAQPELIRSIMPLINEALLIDTNEDIWFAAYSAFIVSMKAFDFDTMMQMTHHVINVTEPQHEHYDYQDPFFRICHEFTSFIPTLTLEQIVKLSSIFMIAYDGEDWPRNECALIPLTACIQRLQAEHIPKILNYLESLSARAVSDELREIYKPANEAIIWCALQLQDNERIKAIIPSLSFHERTLADFFPHGNQDLQQYMINHIINTLESTRHMNLSSISNTIIQLLIDNMEHIDSEKIHRIMPIIIQRINLTTKDDNSRPYTWLHFIIKYMLQTADHAYLDDQLCGLTHRGCKQFLLNIKSNILNLELNPQQPEFHPINPNYKS